MFPRATLLPFAGFNNRFCGQSCHLIGRGVTTFQYEQLTELNEPVFFLNDAVCLEKLVGAQRFFFAHDAQMLPWLNGAMNSTPVIPIDGKIFATTPGINVQHHGDLVFYHWRDRDAHQLLSLNRDELAREKQLFTHTGTIHSALHFIWYCGFTRVVLIGCDGKVLASDSGGGSKRLIGHDQRLANSSRSAAAADYTEIKRVQDLLIQLFGLEAVYVGTPL